MDKRTRQKLERQKQLSKDNNALRFFYLQGWVFELVGTRKNSNGSWTHTIKMPYTDLETKSRYKEIGHKTLLEKIKQYPENEKLIKHYENN